MTTPSEPGVLIIGGWRSWCGDCGRDADPFEMAHRRVLGYGTDAVQPGCGATWTKVRCEHVGIPQANAAVRAMRPDLQWVGDPVPGQ